MNGALHVTGSTHISLDICVYSRRQVGRVCYFFSSLLCVAILAPIDSLNAEGSDKYLNTAIHYTVLTADITCALGSHLNRATKSFFSLVRV